VAAIIPPPTALNQRLVMDPTTPTSLAWKSAAVGRVGTQAITTTETLMNPGLLIPANALVAGATFRLKAMGFWTNTTAAVTSTVRVRCGPTIGAGVGTIAGSIAIAGGTTARTNIPFIIEAMMQVISIGAGGTMLATVFPQVGNVVQPVLSAPVTAAAAINTTVANTLGLTFVTAAATTSVTVVTCTIQQEV